MLRPRCRLASQDGDTGRLRVLYSTSYVQAVSGMLYLEVLMLLVLCMIDSRNGERLVYSDICGWLDWPCTIGLIE